MARVVIAHDPAIAGHMGDKQENVMGSNRDSPRSCGCAGKFSGPIACEIEPHICKTEEPPQTATAISVGTPGGPGTYYGRGISGSIDKMTRARVGSGVQNKNENCRQSQRNE